MANDKLKMENIKPKVFILHGWTYNLGKWEPFVSLLKSKNLNPILLKIPGLTEKTNHPWDIQAYTDWLLDLVKDEEAINLIGHSNGGRIAMNFALKYQSKVKSLVLIDSAGIYHNEIIIKVKRSLFKFIAKTGKKISDSSSLKDILYRLAREKDYRTANQIMKQTMRNLIESDKELKPEKIINKTIIIWGENDKITPLSDGKRLRTLIVNSKLLIVKDARHSPQYTHGDEVAEIISYGI